MDGIGSKGFLVNDVREKVIYSNTIIIMMVFVLDAGENVLRKGNDGFDYSLKSKEKHHKNTLMFLLHLQMR